jgi:hypothetical protein
VERKMQAYELSWKQNICLGRYKLKSVKLVKINFLWEYLKL